MLRKMGIIAVLSLMVTALAAVPAFADITLTQTPTVDASGNLTVSFQEVIPDPTYALNQTTIDYYLIGGSQATYVCLKKNGREPKGGPVIAGSVAQEVNAQQRIIPTLIQDEAGYPASSYSGSFSVSPPPPTNLSCPKGLKLFLGFVSYDGLQLVNPTFGTTTPIPGPITRVFP
jgi:hypothetical protein